MVLREFKESDVEPLRQLFQQQGLEYEFPDVCAKQFIVRHVIEADGKIVMAVMARQTVELYLLADSKWRTPAWRMQALKSVHESVRHKLAALDIEDVHVWIPPQLKNFGRRLMKSFGWAKPLWPNYTRSTRMENK